MEPVCLKLEKELVGWLAFERIWVLAAVTSHLHSTYLPLSLCKDYTIPWCKPRRLACSSEKLSSFLGDLYPSWQACGFHTTCQVHCIPEQLETGTIASQNTCRSIIGIRTSGLAKDKRQLQKKQLLYQQLTCSDWATVQSNSDIEMLCVWTK